MNKYNLSLTLDPADFRRLADLAGYSGMTTAELLEAFIKDLTDSRQRNGSDESDKAAAWLERCGFTPWNYNSFLTWLIDNPGDLVAYKYARAEYKYLSGLPDDLKSREEIEDQREAWEQLQRIYNAYCEYTDEIEPQAEAFRKADRWTEEKTYLEEEAITIKD